MNEKTKHRLLNLRFNIKDHVLWDFCFPCFLKNEKKDSKTTWTFFFFLHVSNVKLRTTTKYFSIRFFAKGSFPNCYLNFKFMVTIACNASINNQ
jgi:hypothetical protein